jgi:hypothetical protein
LGEFTTNITYISAGTRFDGVYSPSGPEPAVDPYTITDRIHISFLPFSTGLITTQPSLFGRYRVVQFNPAQRTAFTWDETELETFRIDFRTNFHSVWSDLHTLVTTEPCFARNRASVSVNVEFVADTAQAHSSITPTRHRPRAEAIAVIQGLRCYDSVQFLVSLDCA